MKYKRLLVISNAAMSQSESNGRTLRNFLIGWDKTKLAQFYTYGTPDFSVCSNYYKVSDIDALKSVLHFKAYGGIQNPEENVAVIDSEVLKKKARKTPLSACLREVVWEIGKWRGMQYRKWIENFSPQIILVFMGDSSFLLNSAMNIAKQFKASLIVYSCEDYYFKKHNYITRKQSLAFRLFHKRYIKTVRVLADTAKECIFISEDLMNRYKTEFPMMSVHYVMTASELYGLKVENGNQITYAGNLGIGRHKALLEIADALQSIDRSLNISLYGRFPNKEIENDILSSKGIEYKGFVTYMEVVEAIRKSRLLIHVESDEEYFINDSKYAFSTKISDCISSGVPFFCYASEKMFFTKFLNNKKCAIVVHNKKEIIEKLSEALNDQNIRIEVSSNAKIVANEYFNILKNVSKFQKILLGE